MGEPLRAVVVDDEPAARKRMVLLCTDIPAVRIVGEAADGASALKLIAEVRPDLVFLDIRMPGMDGMQAAEAMLANPGAVQPAVVFVTAYADFALAAFGVDAAGYLLKPVDPLLLAQTVQRIAARGSARGAPVEEMAALWVPHRGELKRISVDDVDWIAGEGDYVRLHVGGASYLLAERLYGLEVRLDPTAFLRVHRSHIVRRDQVMGLRHLGAGAWAVTLTTGTVVPIGRSYLDVVRGALSVS